MDKKPRLPEGWRVCQSTTYPGRLYYYNINSGCTCWNVEEVLGLIALPPLSPPDKTPSKTHSSIRERSTCTLSQTGQKRKLDNDPTQLDKVKKPYSKSSGYGNSFGSPSVASSSSQMEVCSQHFEDHANVMTEIEELRQNNKTSTVDQITLRNNYPQINDKPTKAIDNLQTLYIIVDTNVLLSSLKVLEHLTLNWKSENELIFIIPWIVLEELDRLKGNRNDVKTLKIRKQAQTAIQYIHAQFKDPNSNVRGQSIDEASKKNDFEPKNNDDHILLCCLALKKKANSSAVILSNDKNLCNKARANRCSAYMADEVEDGITTQLKQLEKGSDSRTAKIYEEIRGRVVSDIYNSFKNTLFRILSSVLSNTMLLVYDADKWKAIVKIKPPWNMVDVFSCFQKHKYAVFSRIFSRGDETILESLKSFFQDDKGRSGSLKVLIANIEKSIQLCIRLQQVKVAKVLCLNPMPNSPYEPLLSVSIDKLRCLSDECQKKCKNVENLKSEVKCVSKDIGPVLPETQNWDLVSNFFTAVGDRIRRFCAIIGTALNIEHSYILPSGFSLPKETDTARLRSEIVLIKNLCVALSKVLSSTDELEINCIELCGALKAFFVSEQEMPKFVEEFSPDILFLFCSKSESHQHLEMGLNEVEDHLTFLERCADENSKEH